MATLNETLRFLFSALDQAATEIGEQDLAEIPTFDSADQPTEILYRLLVGYAMGADQTAISAWNAANIGPVHAVFPYLHGDRDGFAWSNDPALQEAGTEYRVIPDDVNSATVLDGARSEKETPKRSGHLEQARWVVRQCDALVVVWDGETAGGAGGTAESVELALKKGLPIFWLNPARPDRVVLIDPEHVWNDTSLFELRDIAEFDTESNPAFPIVNHAIVKDCIRSRAVPAWLSKPHSASAPPHQVKSGGIRSWLGLVPPTPPESIPHIEETELESFQTFIGSIARFDPVKAGTGTSVYKSFNQRLSRPFQLFGWFWRKTVAGQVRARFESAPAERESYKEDLGLQQTFDRVSEFAVFVSDRHRSQQIIILRLAALAVFFGLLPAAINFYQYKPDPDIELVFKWLCVAAELVVLTAMFVVWWRAKNQKSHLLWSDSRRFAERLRSVRATLPLGFDVSDMYAHAPRTWSEWLIKLQVRALGPPTGKMTRTEIVERGESARRLIIESQANYHTRNAQKSHAIHERIERTENALFIILFVCLVLFVTLVPILATFAPEPFSLDKRVKNGILMMSAFFPAIGASCMALTAQLELTSVSRHSEHVAPRFLGIDKTLRHELENPQQASSTRIMELVREGAQLALSDIDAWRNNLERRKIVRGP